MAMRDHFTFATARRLDVTPVTPHTGGRCNLPGAPEGPAAQGIGVEVTPVTPITPENDVFPRENEIVADFEERAASLEYYEGLTREDAEVVAGQQTARRKAICAEQNPRTKQGGALDLPGGGKASVFQPIAGPGITISAPAVAVSAVAYDRHADSLIAAAGEGTPEAGRLAACKRKGAVLPRGDDKIYTRGRA